MRYRKKPVIIEAIKWTGENDREMFDFLANNKRCNEYMTAEEESFYIDHGKVKGGLVIKTLEGEHIASIGDYIIKGVKGEFYPCKPDIFEQTYEAVEDGKCSSDEPDEYGGRYKYLTPFENLSDRLKSIVRALDTVYTKEWNYASREKRNLMVEKALEPLNVRGMLTEAEIAYLEDCNYHTALNYLSPE